MPVPTLMIPLEIKGNEALAELRKLQTEGEKTGEALADGAKTAEGGFGSMTASILASNAAMQAIGVGKQMLDALSQGAIEASREMKKLAEDFIGLRDRARELAGIMGKPGTSDFTVEQFKFAAETGTTPEAALGFRTAFQGEAAQYASRFAPGQFEEFETQAATYGGQMRLDPAIMAKLAGTVIRTGAKQGQTSEEAMKTLGGAFRTLQAGSGDNPTLAAQLARSSGMVGPENAYENLGEAATAVRMQAETDQSEAYTRMTEMRQGVIELATKPKMAGEAAELGVTPQTTNPEMIKKLSAAQEKSGKNIDVFLAGLFPEKRVRDAFRDNIRAYRGGVMEKGMADVAAVQPGETEAAAAEYLANPEEAGALQKAQAEGKLEEAQRAQERVRIAPLLQKAHNQLAPAEATPQAKMAAGLLDTAPVRWLSGLRGQGYEGVFERAEMGRAVQIGVEEARASGVDPGQVPGVGLSGASSQEVVHFLSRLVQLTEEANKHRQTASQKEQQKPQPAIVPQMPNPAVRH